MAGLKAIQEASRKRWARFHNEEEKGAAKKENSESHYEENRSNAEEPQNGDPGDNDGSGPDGDVGQRQQRNARAECAG